MRLMGMEMMEVTHGGFKSTKDYLMEAPNFASPQENSGLH
jgi:hypothetical protein